MISSDKILQSFKKFSVDKMVHRYELMYSEILDENIKSILEIGIKRGASLAAWRDLYPHIDLYGIDITDKEQIQKNMEYASAITLLKDSTKKGIENHFNNIDLIIDDGSHIPDHQIETFKNFKNNFKKYYVIEDVVHRLYDILTAIKDEGFDNFFVFKSQDTRYTYNTLNTFYKNYGIDFKVEKELENKCAHIHAIVIFR